MLQIMNPRHAALFAMLGAAAALVGAWIFQYGLGYQPCALCLEQRQPYYFGIPLAFLGLLAISGGNMRAGAMALAGFALLFAYGAGLAVYHSGVEWSWWAGPDGCAPSASLEVDASKLLSGLGKTHPPSCTEAAWRLAGLSLAGYNALISAGLAVIAAIGAAKAWHIHRSEDR